MTNQMIEYKLVKDRISLTETNNMYLLFLNSSDNTMHAFRLTFKIKSQQSPAQWRIILVDKGNQS